jgi:hypothetical protein
MYLTVLQGNAQTGPGPAPYITIKKTVLQRFKYYLDGKPIRPPQLKATLLENEEASVFMKRSNRYKTQSVITGIPGAMASGIVLSKMMTLATGDAIFSALFNTKTSGTYLTGADKTFLIAGLGLVAFSVTQGIRSRIYLKKSIQAFNDSHKKEKSISFGFTSGGHVGWVLNF